MINVCHRLYYSIFILIVFITFCPAASLSKEEQDMPEVASSVKGQFRTITYYRNKKITVPFKINRIACGWNAQNSIIAMLGYGDKIVATTHMIKASPIFGKFVPNIKNAVACFLSSGELNIEGLLTTRPDVAFMTSSYGGQQLYEMGIPVALLKANSMKNIVDRAVITGRILGDDAYEQAMHYVDYFNNNVKRVKERISKIPHAKRLKVYHSMGNPLTTCGSPSLVQDWMDMAGAINIAEGWNIASLKSSGQSNTNLEQIIAANPDVIISMDAADAKVIKTDPAWRVISAVKNNRVYVNPKGMFLWCRETTEEALQFLWVAKTLYPDYFKDVDMVKETRYFYKKFYSINLTNEDVEMFLYPK